MKQKPQFTRADYERRFGAFGEDAEYKAAVDAVVGNYLTERAFDEAYAQLVTRGASHEDAVRGAQREVYGQTRSLSVGAPGPENRRAVSQYLARQAGGGGTVPPVVPPMNAMSGMRIDPKQGRMAGQVLALLLAGTGGLIGAGLEAGVNS
jgi:hypothetical protein